MEPKYSCEDESKESRWKFQRDWAYTMAGIYNNGFEKIEKKRGLLNRSFEVQLKG